MRVAGTLFGITLRQAEFPQRCDAATLDPIYFSKEDEEYLQEHLLEIQKHFQIRNWRIVTVDFE